MAQGTEFTKTSETRRRRVEREEAERRLRKGEEPWREEAGVQSVVDAVRDVPFPTERTTLSEKAGDRVVHVSGKLEIPLAEVLEKLNEDRFEDVGAFQTAVMRHWEGIRYLEVPEEQRPPEGGGRPRQRAARARGTQSQKKANLRAARRGKTRRSRVRQAAERLKQNRARRGGTGGKRATKKRGATRGKKSTRSSRGKR